MLPRGQVTIPVLIPPFLWPRSAMDLDTGVPHPWGEDLYPLNVRVKSSKDITNGEEMGPSSERVEDTSESDGDVTSADDDDSLRSILEMGKEKNYRR